MLFVMKTDRSFKLPEPGAFPLFFESRKRSMFLFIRAFRTENRRALFLEMLYTHIRLFVEIASVLFHMP